MTMVIVGAAPMIKVVRRRPSKMAVAARWADRKDALRAILTPEQMAIY